jgi:hypothetical protein
MFEKKLNVFCGDFRNEQMLSLLGKGDIVWSNMSIIHLPIEELEYSFKVLCSYLFEDGILGIRFKTGNDISIIDKADEKYPVDRRTSFYKIEAIKKLYINNNLEWLATIEKPKMYGKYTYSWIIGRKKGSNNNV